MRLDGEKMIILQEISGSTSQNQFVDRFQGLNPSIFHQKDILQI